MDDNLITAAMQEACYVSRATHLAISEAIGWPTALDKLKEDAPSQKLPFRGVVFDTINQRLSIPVSKLQATARRTRELLEETKLMRAKKTRSSFQVRRIRSIQGRFGWINQIHPMGRLHTHHMARCIPWEAQNKHMMNLSKSAVADLKWWDAFFSQAVADGGLESWASFKPITEGPIIRIFCDASGDFGFGGTALGRVIAGTWSAAAHSEAPSSPSIAWKELVAVYFLVREIAPVLPAGSTIIVTTDNESNAYGFNNGDAKDGQFDLFKLICLELFPRGIRIFGDWVTRKFNTLPDLWSRLQPLPGLPPPASSVPPPVQLPSLAGGPFHEL